MEREHLTLLFGISGITYIIRHMDVKKGLAENDGKVIVRALYH
jgi:hypothetical protein